MESRCGQQYHNPPAFYIDTHMKPLHTSFVPFMSSTFLTAEQNKSLCDRWANGDESARMEMIEAYVPLALAMARRFGGGDEVRSGALWGLMDAASDFNPTKSTNFGGWAMMRIRGGIREALCEKWVVRPGDRTIKLIRSIQEAYKDLESELGRAPEAHELSAVTGLPVRRIVEVLPLLAGIKRMDAGLCPDSQTTVGDVVTAEDVTWTVKRDEAMYSSLAAAIETLKPEQRDIVQACIDGMTFSEIGSILCITPQAVSLRYKKIISLLRRRMLRAQKCE